MPFYIACCRFLKSYLQADIRCRWLPIPLSHLDFIIQLVQLVQAGCEFTFSAAESTLPTQPDLYLSANDKFRNGTRFPQLNAAVCNCCTSLAFSPSRKGASPHDCHLASDRMTVSHHRQAHSVSASTAFHRHIGIRNFDEATWCHLCHSLELGFSESWHPRS